MGWISVEDRLPEIDARVLAYGDWPALDWVKEYDGTPTDIYLAEIFENVGDFADNKDGDTSSIRWVIMHNHILFNVTHWMPLPDKPEVIP